MAALKKTSEVERGGVEKISQVKEALRTVKDISDLLNTGLDDDTLKVCVQLLEAGINPEALATVVLELRRESAALRDMDHSSTSSTRDSSPQR